MVDHIVAVGRAVARLHEGRGIEMRDAERLQVGYDVGGALEIEIGGQLQTVGGERNGRRHASLRCTRLPTRAEVGRRYRRPRSVFRSEMPRDARSRWMTGWLLATALCRRSCANWPSTIRRR